eukprot:877827-Ditylum_brightwellii.AAC.2
MTTHAGKTDSRKVSANRRLTKSFDLSRVKRIESTSRHKRSGGGGLHEITHTGYSYAAKTTNNSK